MFRIGTDSELEEMELLSKSLTDTSRLKYLLHNMDSNSPFPKQSPVKKHNTNEPKEKKKYEKIGVEILERTIDEPQSMKMNNIKYLIKKHIEDKFVPKSRPEDKELEKIKRKWEQLKEESSEVAGETFTKEEEDAYKRTEQLAQDLKKNPGKVIESMLLVRSFYNSHRKKQGLTGKIKDDNGS